MDLSAVMGAILTHATASAAAVTPPITDVAIGLPLPRGRCVRVYWDGEARPVAFTDDQSLNSKLIAHQVSVTAYWPVSDAAETPAASRMTEMTGFVDGLRSAVLADSQLGGQATDLAMDYAKPDFVQIGGGLYAIVSATFTVDYAEYSRTP